MGKEASHGTGALFPGRLAGKFQFGEDEVHVAFGALQFVLADANEERRSFYFFGEPVDGDAAGFYFGNNGLEFGEGFGVGGRRSGGVGGSRFFHGFSGLIFFTI